MNVQPLVSVITPSYNQARWLRANLASVAAQRYPLVEQIVIDGGSTDGSVEILRESAHPALSWSSAPDRGQSDAINRGFRRSSGEIVGWLNSDDAYFTPEAISAAVGVFMAHPDVSVVYGHAVLADPGGRVLQLLWVPSFSYSLLRVHNFIYQPAAFIRKSAVRDSLVDERFDYMMDRELWLRLAATSKLRRIDEILAIDRHHAMRKSYTRLDLARSDEVRLTSDYSLPRGVHVAILRKAAKIAMRLIALRLLARASRSTPAVGGRATGLLGLAIRQLFVPRRFMRS